MSDACGAGFLRLHTKPEETGHAKFLKETVIRSGSWQAPALQGADLA